MTPHTRYGRVVLGILFLVALYPLFPYIVPLFMGVVLCTVGWRTQLAAERTFHLPRSLAAAIHAIIWVAIIALPTWSIVRTVVDNVGPLIHKWQAGAPLITVPPTVIHTPIIGHWLAAQLQALNAKALLHYLSNHSSLIRSSVSQVWIFLLHTLIAAAVVFSLSLRGERAVKELTWVTETLWGTRGPQFLAIATKSARAVMLGLIGVGLIEGVLIGVSYGIAGMPVWSVWLVATTLLSAVPFGAGAILAIVAGWLMLTGHLLAGFLVIAWGITVITAADLLLRPLVTGVESSVPFLILLLSILGGAKVFGLVGIIAGPLLIMMASSIWQSWFRDIPSPSTSNN